jgi:PPOX class probable F420-dependent enzyme
MNQDEARSRLAAASVARLATADASGRPHLVPMTFGVAVWSGPDVIFSAVDSKPKTTRRLKRLANVAANPAASVLVDHYDSDWTQLWWVRADGLARIVASGPEFEAAVAALQEKYPQYRQAPPAGPVLLIEVSSWTSWAANN